MVSGLAMLAIVTPSWSRHLTVTVPLSIPVNKRVRANLMQGLAPRWTSIPSGVGGGEEIILVASCYRNRDKLRTSY